MPNSGARQSNIANTASLPAYTVLDASLAYTHSPQLALPLAAPCAVRRAPCAVQLAARASF